MINDWLDTSMGIGCLLAFAFVVALLVEGVVLMLAWNLVIVGALGLTTVTLPLWGALLVAAALHVLALIF